MKKLDQRITYLCDEKHLNKLKEVADKTGLPYTTFVRMVVEKAIRKSA